MAREAAVLNAPEGDARKGGVRALVGRQLHVATRLAGKALQIARALWREAAPAAARAGVLVNLDWLWSAHAKFARALRMSVLLHARLLVEMKQCETAEAAGPLDEAEAEKPDRPDSYSRFERAESAESAESLESYGVDRLRRYVMTRPVDQLIEEIRDGLGLTPEWLRQIEREWSEQARDESARPSPAAPPAKPTPPPSAPSPAVPLFRPNRAMRRAAAARGFRPRAASP